MRKLLIMLACMTLALSAQALIIEHTNTAALVISQTCGGNFDDFKFQVSGYDNQKFKFTYDQSLVNTYCSFRIVKPIEGTIYLDVPYTDITIATTSVTWSVARTNIPPPGNYYGELLSYGSTETNVYRSIAQGKIIVTWSLYLNETNYFNRSTTNAQAGQVYIHPSWTYPPWSTNVITSADTNRWNTGATDATSATTSVARINLNVGSISGDLDTAQADLIVVSNTAVANKGNLTVVSNDLDTTELNVTSVSNDLVTTKGNLTVVSNVAAAAYPASNPSNYVTVAVTNGYASTSWVDAAYYLKSNPSNFVDQTVTNAMHIQVTNEIAVRISSNSTLQGEVDNLNGATQTLDTAVTNLQNSTGTLDTAIGTLQIATQTLDTAVGNLNSVTNTLNSGLTLVTTSLFAGAATTGRVTSTVGDAANFLRGDGTWAVSAGDVFAWSGYNATQQIAQTVTGPDDVYGTNNLLVTGATTPDVSGTYTSCPAVNGYPAWTNAPYMISYNNADVYEIPISASVADNFYLTGTSPIGLWTQGAAVTGTPFVIYSGITTQTWQYGPSGTAWKVSMGGVEIQRGNASSNVFVGKLYGNGAGLTNLPAPAGIVTNPLGANLNANGKAITNLSALWVDGDINVGGNRVTNDSNAKYSFSVTNSTAQIFTNEAYRLMLWSSEEWDLNNCFSGNAYSPTNSGTYLFNCGIYVNGTFAANRDINIQLYKDGTGIRQVTPHTYATASYIIYSWSFLDRAVTATNVYNLYIFPDDTVTQVQNGLLNYWQGTRIGD